MRSFYCPLPDFRASSPWLSIEVDSWIFSVVTCARCPEGPMDPSAALLRFLLAQRCMKARVSSVVVGFARPRHPDT